MLTLREEQELSGFDSSIFLARYEGHSSVLKVATIDRGSAWDLYLHFLGKNFYDSAVRMYDFAIITCSSAIIAVYLAVMHSDPALILHGSAITMYRFHSSDTWFSNHNVWYGSQWQLIWQSCYYSAVIQHDLAITLYDWTYTLHELVIIIHDLAVIRWLAVFSSAFKINNMIWQAFYDLVIITSDLSLSYDLSLHVGRHLLCDLALVTWLAFIMYNLTIVHSKSMLWHMMQ